MRFGKDSVLLCFQAEFFCGFLDEEAVRIRFEAHFFVISRRLSLFIPNFVQWAGKSLPMGDRHREM